jgi:hypothetical protein
MNKMITCDFDNNTSDGKQIVSWKNKHNITIEDESFHQLFLANVTESQMINCTFPEASRGLDLYGCNGTIIKNSTFSNHGIFVGESALNITQCEFYNAGISIDDSWECIIEDCELFEGGVGIEFSDNCRIMNTTLFEGNGISLNFARNTEIIDSIMVGDLVELELHAADNSVIKNVVIEGGYQIWIFSSESLTMQDCDFGNSNFVLSGHSEELLVHDINNVTINGKKLGYFTYLEDTIIDHEEYGQIILVYCANVQIVSENNTASAGIRFITCANCEIKGITVLGNPNVSNQRSITIEDGSENCTVRDCFIQQCVLFVSGSDGTVVKDNLLVNNSRIYAYGCDGLLIEGNTIINSTTGIATQSNGLCNITSNYIDGCTFGINDLGGSVRVSNCTIRNSVYDGIFAYHSDAVIISHTSIFNSSRDGVSLEGVDGFSVEGSVVTETNRTGIRIISSRDGEINRNRIYFSNELGINITESTNISAYANAIGWNTLGNSIDNSGNTWEYNYWDDYQSIEVDDPYPTLLETPETLLPLINHPDDMILDENSTKWIITWAPCVLEPSSYTILINDTTFHETEWNGDRIVFQLWSLQNAAHNITIIVLDSQGNSVVDSVIVRVDLFTLPITTTGTDSAFIFMIFVVFVPGGIALLFILILFYRKRRE